MAEQSDCTAGDSTAAGSSSSSSRPAGFGGRFLTKESDVYSQNAWDNVGWTEEDAARFEELIAANSSRRVSEQRAAEIHSRAAENWDKFYSVHTNRFFKDRQWLLTEFPQLTSATSVLEVGCGVGNTALPLLRSLPHLQRLYACDHSPLAVQLLQEAADFDAERCTAFVADVSSSEDAHSLSRVVPPNSLDAVLLVFTLSALAPQQMPQAVRQLAQLLKPGGCLLFRDYGRFDLAQVRFKPGACLQDHLYARADGTRAYFFTEEDCERLFGEVAGLHKRQLITDRRLQVNRAKQLKMYRIWVQACYQRPQL